VLLMRWLGALSGRTPAWPVEYLRVVGGADTTTLTATVRLSYRTGGDG
jgi:hypothetical protein